MITVIGNCIVLQCIGAAPWHPHSYRTSIERDLIEFYFLSSFRLARRELRRAGLDAVLRGAAGERDCAGGGGRVAQVPRRQPSGEGAVDEERIRHGYVCYVEALARSFFRPLVHRD